MRPLQMAAIALGAAALVTATACGNPSRHGAGASVSATSTGEPPATLTPGAITMPRTDVPLINAAINATLARDTDALLRLVHYPMVPCILEPVGIGAPPQCRAAEIEGEPVAVLPIAQCEGAYLRPEDVPHALEGFLGTDIGYYNAYRIERADFWPPGAYAAVFEMRELGRRNGRELVLDDRGIVGLNYACGGTAAELVAFQNLREPLRIPAATPSTPPPP